MRINYFIFLLLAIAWSKIEGVEELSGCPAAPVFLYGGKKMYRITVRPKIKKTDVSKDLYGLFFEDINRAGDGGLYAELLRNRAFDEGVLPEGCAYDKVNKLITSPTGWVSSFDCYEKEGIAGWEAVDGACMNLTDKNTLHKNRKRALEVSFSGGSIRNAGFQGVFVEQGKSYRFFMFAKADREVEVTVALTSKTGEIYTSFTFAVCGDYTKYECELECAATDVDARLSLSSQADEQITFGFTSLFPKDTYQGRENGLRNSLVERLLQLHPAFLRFPGGCIVEGFSKETAFRFKDTIGPVWERKPHWLLWSYMTTNGLGYHEYLQFCEDAGIDAMYVFNCGMTCQGRNPDYFEDALIEEFYEDAVQAILYATAPANTEWGAKRAANGHPEPFTVLKYLEIGNENWGPEYQKRYRKFYERLKQEFPQFVYISTDHTEHAGLPTEMVDEHFYSDPVFFAVNETMYDTLDRNGVDIYCGEYAATIGCKEGILHAALGEAAFLCGIERNQDKVKMTSYAPLFQNVAYKAWEPDMILFNNHEDVVIPSYHMLSMFASNRGDYVCEHTVETEYQKQITDHARDAVISETVSGENARVKFWDNGLSGEDQNHYDWILENGKSKILHYNGWSCESICPEILCTGAIKRENTVEIRTEADCFAVSLNGEVLHQKELALIPDITAVCTVDESSGELITKVVNFSEKEIAVKMSIEADMQEEATVTILTGDSYLAKNTFAEKEKVKPYLVRVAAASEYELAVKPRSVYVVRQKIK
ncbi:MAG: carbohydrate binding domain-containing protein [Lachnospiraceae bacterium]|nr:carbohydrate binding domain-containing protein [Lachnospiraceae bacterium]